MATAPCVMRRARPRVLLVEDNAVNRKVAMQALARAECEVVEACDGRAAVEACAAQRFDVVLMDCHMPVMDGVEATVEIRRTIAHPPPIVALTANAHDGDRARCLEAGMVDFLSKPFRLNDLRAVVRRWADRGVSV
jgi:CheY-like chemotaxis protein